MLLNSLFKHWSYRIISPGTLLREKYEALKQLLHFDIGCHEKMAELQGLLHGGHREDFARIRHRFNLFSAEVAGMVDALETMNPGSYSALKSYHKKFNFYTRFLLAPPEINCSPPFVVGLEEISENTKEIGNKAKNLACLQNETEIPIPHGFAIPACGYHYFIEYNKLREKIDCLLTQLDIESPASLTKISHLLQELVADAEVPPKIVSAILFAYDSHIENSTLQPEVAVRSSAISEDGKFSFAGQYATELKVTKTDIASGYKVVIASKYSQEALYYRISKGLGDEETAMCVLVQEMVPAKASGVLYTRGVRKNSTDQDLLHLHVADGLGEQLVGGTVRPDSYILQRRKPFSIVSSTINIPLLTTDQIVVLAKLGIEIEDYFSTAQDIEWAIDSADQPFILQARELHISNKVVKPEPTDIILPTPSSYGNECASPGVASGKIYRMESNNHMEEVPEGAVLVTRDIPPSLVKCISRLSAVLAEKGSKASHFATVAREFGVPLLTGIDNARNIFKPDSTVTVDGDSGTVFPGRIDALIETSKKLVATGPYHRTVSEALKFITPLELTDPEALNFTPEGCRSMHDIIRFCHEKALMSMFTTGRPGTGRGALRLAGDIPLDVFLFDVGGGITTGNGKNAVPLKDVGSAPFQALWKGLSHPKVQWKQKPFDWDAYDKIELSGGIPPKKDSFAFASYAVIGTDYLHFNIRFGYHFTILDVLCGENSAENHCMLRFAGGGGDYDHRSFRIHFITGVLEKLDFSVDKKGDLLEAKLPPMPSCDILEKLDILGRLLGATKLMDMVLDSEKMAADCVEEFFKGRYSFSQEG